MKNFTNNFKQITSRLSARWLIMALMLLVGTSSAWGATVTFKGTEYLYVTNSQYSWWNGDNAYTGLYFYGSNGNAWSETFVVLSQNSRTAFKVPAGTWTHVIIVRKGSNSKDWNNKYNQSGDISLESAKNHITKFTEGSTTATWDTYKPTSTGKLTASSASVNTNTNVTLTPSLTSNTTYNEIKSTTYAISPSTGASINGNTFTATVAGTYTITATITYNPKGYSSLTSTVKPTTTITVEDPCTLPTSISIDGEATPCAGNSQTYIATLDEGSGYTSSWTVPSGYTINSGSTTTSASIIVGTAAGKITYTATCSSSSKISKDFDVAPINIVEPTISISNDGWTCPGANATITVKNAVLDGTYTYTLFNDEDVQKGEVVKPTSGDVTFTVSTEDTYYVKATNACESKNSENVKLNNYSKPENPAVKITAPTKCQGVASNNGVINMKNPVLGVTYTLTKDGTTYTRRNNEWIGLAPGIYTLTADLDACSGLSDSWDIELTAEDITPVVEALTMPEDFSSCDKQLVQGIALQNWKEADGYTYTYQWQSSANGNSFTNMDGMTSSGMTPLLNETTWYRVKVKKTGNNCTSDEATSKAVKVTALPLSTPEVTASAYSGVNAIELTITVPNAGCAENYTLGYRIKQSDDLEYSENQVVKASTTETQASTTIEGLVTGVEYMIQAYIINGYNNDEVFYTAPITCTVLASEICDVPSANYIEILANNDENLQLYAWVEGKGTTPLGGWPGATRDTWYEVNSTGYSVWKIETLEPVFIIFNKGDNSKTADIKGPNNEGLKPGYRYIYDVNLSTWNYTTQDPTLIADPEVETISATPERIDETKSNVTLVGRIIKRGCADIRSYGFQYKLIDAKDYTNLEVGTGDIEPGSTFTGSLELGVGTYYLRARVENENGSKAYGDVIRVTIANRDLTIAAIDDDISVDTDTYYDFVGLYMSSITKPTTVDIESYTWYKDGSVYNPSIAESDKYGGKTYINTNGSNNIRPNQIGDYQLKVLLANGTILESNVIKVNKASAVSASSILNASNRTLPVISVRTNEDFPKCSSGSYPSAQADKLKKKRSVDVKIFDKDGKLYYDRKARMNYRGSSSLNFVKKSYAFCPGGDMCGDVEKGLDYVITEKVNMFNLGASDKDWVLYAAAADPSMMRNRIVFDTYAAMTNKWGVKSMFVELVVDGEYKGVYVFMDKITKNKDRVNITAADGFIVKFDKTDTVDRYVDGKQEDGDEKTFMTERTGRQGISTYGTTVDQMFEIEYPEKDENKGTWNNIVASIKDKFETFETALAEGNYSKVREIIDYDSWADWFIINEYIKNQDAYRASCIFVYNGEKIEARPLWDQELSMNNTCRTSNGSGNTSGLLIENDGVYSDCFPAPFWFTGKNAQFGSCGGNNGSSTLGTAYSNYLLKDGCFIGLVQQKLADYLKEGAALYAGTDENNGPLLKLATTFNKELTSKTEGQTSAQEREASFWTGKTRATADCSGDTGYTDKSYSTEYNNLSGWIKGDRDENLTSILGGMSGEMSAGISITTSPANAIVTPWIPITVTVNVAGGAEYFYDDTSIINGIDLDVDKAITSKSGNKYTYTFPRPAKWETNNVDTPIQQIVYPINAKLKVYDTVCPGLSNEAGVYIKLKDEGNDICGELVEQ